jgi:hypothetical protein
MDIDADVISAHGCDPGFVRTGELDFCLVNSNSILITFGPDGNPTVNAPAPPCDSLVQATASLGHASGQRSERDRDVFRFEGDAGDEVIVTLEPEGTMGSTGEDARLILRNQSDGPLRGRRERAAAPGARGGLTRARELRSGGRRTTRIVEPFPGALSIDVALDFRGGAGP